MHSQRPITRSRLSATAAATVLLTIGATITAVTSPATAAPAAVAHDDFNGDGYPDLVVSAPGGTVSAKKGAGYVAVLYGSAKGVSASRRATFSLSTPGITGLAQTADHFGQSTASGDLDGDGFADLVVGIPGKDIGSAVDAGAATVLFGSKGGLHGPDSLSLRDDTPKTKGGFATGLATGRFTGAGTRLAVLTRDGVWTYGIEYSPALRGPRVAAVASPSEWWSDYVPAGLTSGDYNKDGADDLVVLGTQFAYEGGLYLYEKHGSALYLPGGSSGLAYGRQLTGGATGTSGDLNKDGYADLVLGSPADYDYWCECLVDGGSVDVHLGGADGPGGQGSGHQVWNQSSPGVPGAETKGDSFGGAIAVGDINGDGYADAAIGAPGNDIGKATDAGTVWVFRGSAAGLTVKNIHTLGQDSWKVPGTPEKADAFGSALRLIDADRNGKAGLVVGAPGEDTNDGGAWVFSGTGSGLTTSGSWSFNGATIHAPSPDARFGGSLAP
ncbi:FG-GAP-like repeat-containing protein [Streptomyces sp. NPDC058691]|uniref:FG-GAP-like repeat-containing protein n=1 Tax=Streptomyces sp. NPDC058691 TaxID=3346601 RepID=UPI00364AEF65